MSSVFIFRRLLAIVLAIVLSACSTSSPKPREVVIKPPAPPAPRVIPPPKPLSGQALIYSLLPSSLTDRRGWAADILSAFEAIKIPADKSNVCAVLAEIGQESSFQTDPVVFGLSNMVRKELESNREKYSIPQWVMDKSLAFDSPNGRTYNQRIDALRTENDLYELYEDMISEIVLGKKLLSDYNPVQTVGPMQVNLRFASEYAAIRPYPYPYRGSIRNALVTRKGGLYFGVAYLLDYPASYDNISFRFADFNAGRYSSRNAAFQNALRYVTGVALKRDGDLLRYKDGVALEDDSQTMRALLQIATRLNMDKDDLFRNLLLEKSHSFEQSRLYKKLFVLAPNLPRAYIPEIVVAGPKTSGKLTTALYTKKVYGRYQRCMKK